MFEFAGRFYKTGVSAASVSSTVTIGGKDNGGNTSSIERSTQGTSSNPSGANWSYRNYYQHHTYYGSWTEALYKANHLFSQSDVIVVRDFDRITKGATTDATRDYNIEAK